MSPLPLPKGPSRPPATYEDFLARLPRDAKKFPYYYSHQTKVLDEYEAVPKDRRDVAICLPTGTGKTLIALSIARFAQVRVKQRVLYLCPSKQLAKQVGDEASVLGIPVVSLVGRWEDVPSENKEKYTAGEAIGVASYWTLFNSNPKVGTPEFVIFDDVHAAGDAALNPWAITIEKKNQAALFEDILAILRAHVPTSQLDAALPGAPLGRAVELVKARPWLMSSDAVENALDGHVQADQETQLRFPWRLARGHLDTSFCFLSPGRISIRPWCPPAFSLDSFASARRRIHLTATLDPYGHLERVMGVYSVVRLGNENVQIPGRRMILNLNRLVPGVAEVRRVTAVAKSVGRALILVPSIRDRDEVIADLAAIRYDGRVLGASDTGEADSPKLDAEVDEFRRSDRAILVLANRYDGLDLGHDSCRTLILWRLPLAVGALEEFTTAVWRQQRAAEARARQRVQQGMGRCTRAEGDDVAVCVAGDDLVQFLLRPDVQKQLPPRLRAELEYGLGQLRDSDAIDDYLTTVHGRGDDWRNVCTQLDEIAAGLAAEPIEVDPAAAVHRNEAHFSELLWARNYSGAVDLALKSAQDLVGAKDDPAAAPWFYLASVAEDTRRFAAEGAPYNDEGARFLKEAASRASGRTWVGELSEYAEPPTVVEGLRSQVERVEAFLAGYPTQTPKLRTTLEEAFSGLSQASAPSFHSGLRVLGEAIGFKAISPKRPGAADCLWSDGDALVAAFEAKTDKDPNGEISIAEARQITDVVESTRHNEGLSIAAGALPIVVTPVSKIAGEAAKDLEHFLVVRPDAVRALAARTFAQLQRLHAKSAANSEARRRRIEGLLRELRLAPSQLQVTLGAKLASKVMTASAPRKQ